MIVLTICPQPALLFLLPFGRPRGFFGGRGPVGSFLDGKVGRVIMNEKDGYLYVLFFSVCNYREWTIKSNVTPDEMNITSRRTYIQNLLVADTEQVS